MSGLSQRRLLLLIVAFGIAAGTQVYMIILGDGDVWAIIAVVCFSVIVLSSGWQLWSQH